MTDARRDLSALTGGRAGALAGKLTPRPAPTPAAEPTTEQEPAPAPPPATPPPRPRRRTAPTVAAGAESWRKQSWPAYIPAPLLERIRADVEDRTLGEWLLDAYEAVHDRLPARFPQRTPTAGLPPRTRRPRRGTGGLVEVQLRLTRAEVAVLEQRMDDLGGPSRSAFVTAVAELYLGS